MSKGSSAYIPNEKYNKPVMAKEPKKGANKTPRLHRVVVLRSQARQARHVRIRARPTEVGIAGDVVPRSVAELHHMRPAATMANHVEGHQGGQGVCVCVSVCVGVRACVRVCARL